MLYIDTSCLVKIFLPDPESMSVIEKIGMERHVIISSLAELETMIQLKARYLGGDYNLSRFRTLEAQFSSLRDQPPYEVRTLPGSILRTALRQHKNSGRMHCRTIDRLHLAAMEELKVSRLMTHDRAQAAVAEDLGMEVVRPGRP